MAKKKKKKGQKKRNLKYGYAPDAPKDIEKKEVGEELSQENIPDNPYFRQELRKNIIFVTVFLGVLFAFYFLLTQTNILDSILEGLGFGGLY